MKSNKIIYALCCPFTNSIHYIGKSTQGMTRPLEHLKKSHSEKIREWVIDLQTIGYSPIVKILEYVSAAEDLDFREKYWIQSEINKGSLLLNAFLITPITISPNINTVLDGNPGDEPLRIGKFIKEQRKLLNYSQPEFADRCGVALTVLRKIEQGKTNINMNGVIQILKMFGCTLAVEKTQKMYE
jgi:DNA-binding XRE family transcriptional regulator